MDKQEQNLLKTAKLLKEDNDTIINSLVESKNKLQRDWVRLKSGIEEHGDKPSKSYTAAKQMRIQTKHFKTKCHSILKSVHIRGYKFKPSNPIQSMISKQPFYRELVEVADIPHANFAGELHISQSSDSQVSCITGMAVIPPEHLLVADSIDKSVKLIDINSQVIVTRVEFSSAPFDIAFVPDKVATTFPTENKLKILSAEKSLSEVQDIFVDSKCL